MIIRAARVLGPDCWWEPGFLEVRGTRITAAGPGSPPADPGVTGELSEGLTGELSEGLTGELSEGLTGESIDLGAVMVVPGFVDSHCHGGGGGSFDSQHPDEVLRTIAAHRALGTTSQVASLVSAPINDLAAALRRLAPFVQAGELAGVHLEGPWLAPGFRGAHDLEALTTPDPAVLQRLWEASEGTLTMVTLAPELDGALDAIDFLVRRHVVVAIGHTASDYGTTVAALAAGARGATHLFNAMPPLHHRNPGPVLALVEHPDVTLELIMDGVHVRPELVRWLVKTCPGRVAFVTDAISAATCGDGDYQLGGLPVTVLDGVARLTGSDTIAGSTLTLDHAVRNAVAAGIALPDALRAVTQVPAGYLGLTDVGVFRPGCQADLVMLTEDLRVSRVMRRGRWCP